MLLAQEPGSLVLQVSAALNVALAAVIVYLTARDKIKYDAKMLKLEHVVEKQAIEIAQLKPDRKDKVGEEMT